MAIALAYPDSEQGKRKTSLLNNEVSGGYIRQARFVLRHCREMVDSINDFDKAYLSHARFVLRHCRDKAEEVLRNAKYPLTVAYEEAQASF